MTVFRHAPWLLAISLLLPGGAASRAQAPAPPPTTQNCIEVVAEGSGTTPDAARKDACRAAVAQVVGMLVVATDRVQNDAVIESKILTYSDGYVVSLQPMGKPTTTDGLVRIKLRVMVQRGKLAQALLQCAVPATETQTVDLRGLQAQAESTTQQTRSAQDLVYEAFKDFPACVLKATPLTASVRRGDDSGTVIEIPVRVEVDPKRWSAWTDRLKEVLDRVATERGEELWGELVPEPDLISLRCFYRRGSGRPPSSNGAWWERRFRNPEQPILCFPHQSTAQREHHLCDLNSDGSEWCRSPEGLNVIFTPGERRMRELLSLRGIVGLMQSDGTGRWWKLPMESFRCIHTALRWPAANITLADADGSPIPTTTECDWEELVTPMEISAAPFKLVERQDGIGRVVLRVGNGKTGDGGRGACFSCALIGKQSKWPLTPLASDTESMLLHPSGTIWFERSFVRTPAMIFPFHFRVSAEEANRIGSAKVSVSIQPWLPKAE